jgi:hypothetical protein
MSNIKIAEIWQKKLRKSGKKLRKSGKNSNIKIKIAEIWERSRYQKCGNMGKKCRNMATFHMRNSGNLSIFLILRKYGKMLRNCGVFPNKTSENKTHF